MRRRLWSAQAQLAASSGMVVVVDEEVGTEGSAVSVGSAVVTSLTAGSAGPEGMSTDTCRSRAQP